MESEGKSVNILFVYNENDESINVVYRIEKESKSNQLFLRLMENVNSLHQDNRCVIVKNSTNYTYHDVSLDNNSKILLENLLHSLKKDYINRHVLKNNFSIDQPNIIYQKIVSSNSKIVDKFMLLYCIKSDSQNEIVTPNVTVKQGLVNSFNERYCNDSNFIKLKYVAHAELNKEQLTVRKLLTADPRIIDVNVDILVDGYSEGSVTVFCHDFALELLKNEENFGDAIIVNFEPYY